MWSHLYLACLVAVSGQTVLANQASQAAAAAICNQGIYRSFLPLRDFPAGLGFCSTRYGIPLITKTVSATATQRLNVLTITSTSTVTTNKPTTVTMTKIVTQTIESQALRVRELPERSTTELLVSRNEIEKDLAQRADPLDSLASNLRRLGDGIIRTACSCIATRTVCILKPPRLQLPTRF
jgi:hypothetical protein